MTPRMAREIAVELAKAASSCAADAVAVYPIRSLPSVGVRARSTSFRGPF
jgi:hypothetical protein